MSHCPNASCLVGADRSVFLLIRSPTLFTHMDTLVPGDIDTLFIWERNSLPPICRIDMRVYSHVFVSYTCTLSSVYMELEQDTHGVESVVYPHSSLSHIIPSLQGHESGRAGQVCPVSRGIFSHKTLVCGTNTQLWGSFFLQTLSCFFDLLNLKSLKKRTSKQLVRLSQNEFVLNIGDVWNGKVYFWAFLPI